MRPLWILASIIVWLATPAAAMNKCVSPEGRTTYTSEACPHDARSAQALKLKTEAAGVGVGVTGGNTPDEAYLRARRAFDNEGFDSYVKLSAKAMRDKMADAKAKGGAQEAMKKLALGNYKIVSKTPSPDDQKTTLKVEATGLNPMTGTHLPITGTVEMVREGGRWVLQSEDWK